MNHIKILSIPVLLLFCLCSHRAFAKKESIAIKKPLYSQNYTNQIFSLDRIVLTDSTTQLYISIRKDSCFWRHFSNRDTWMLPDSIHLICTSQITDNSPREIKLLYCKGYGKKNGKPTTIDLKGRGVYSLRTRQRSDEFILDRFVLSFQTPPKSWKEVLLRGYIENPSKEMWRKHPSSYIRIFGIRMEKENRRSSILNRHTEPPLDSLPDWEPQTGRVIINTQLIDMSMMYSGQTYTPPRTLLGNDVCKSLYPDQKSRDLDLGMNKYEFVDLVRPTAFSFSYNDPSGSYSLIVRPGDEITIHMDANRLLKWNKELWSTEGLKKKAGKKGKKFSYHNLICKNTSRWGGMPEIDELWTIVYRWSKRPLASVSTWSHAQQSESFNKYSEKMWKCHLTRLKEIKKKKFSLAQREYLTLMSEWMYISGIMGGSPASGFTPTNTIAKDLQILRSRKGAYMIDDTDISYQYLLANDLIDTPLGRWLNDLDAAQKLFKRIEDGCPVKDEDSDTWNTVNPIYWNILKAKNEEVLRSEKKFS